MAGYSPKNLVDKLGYKPGQTVCLQSAPVWLKQELESNGVLVVDHLPADWLHSFFSSTQELRIFCENFLASQPKNGLWVSWPKKSSGVQADLTEQSFRNAILPLSWVDVKVTAVDDIWSGLKFLRRKPS